MGEQHLNVWEELMGFLLLENVRWLRRATRQFDTRCVAGITLNEETIERNANASIPLVVAYKEEFGYEKLSDRIKKEGLKNVVASLRKRKAENRRK